MAKAGKPSPKERHQYKPAKAELSEYRYRKLRPEELGNAGKIDDMRPKASPRASQKREYQSKLVFLHETECCRHWHLLMTFRVLKQFFGLQVSPKPHPLID